MAALRSPRDSLNTPKMLMTPIIKDDMLSTPTLTTPRPSDWGPFSPAKLSSCSSSPGVGREHRDPPSELPLDSSIGLSSPHDGILAKRRKLKQQNSGARSIESDSNSCDTPDSMPKDLSNHVDRVDRQDDNRPTDLSTTKRSKLYIPGGLGPPDSVDSVRDRVGAVNISSSSPKRFKHPRSCDSRLGDLRHVELRNSDSRYSDLKVKDDINYHPSPLAVPSPNWSTINDFMSEGLALKTPKVLDNFVFDVLPPNTPNTPKNRDKSPERVYDRHFERRIEDRRRPEARVSFANHPPRPTILTPPPPYPQDLSLRSKAEESSAVNRNRSIEELKSLRHKSMEEMVSRQYEMLIPKQEVEECSRAASASPSLRAESISPGHGGGEIKEEPQEYSSIPPGFPPYYLHPGITPGQLYREPEGGLRHHPSPPATPPLVPNIHTFYQQPRGQFYPTSFNMRHQSMLYEQHQGQPNYLWGHQQVQHQPSWGSQETGHTSGYKPGIALPIKAENRLSAESPEMKKLERRTKDDLDLDETGQPPKKRGKGKGKKEPGPDGGPKRVFVCPHCQRSYDWNYNLNRHLKYECGKENSFMCSKCGRRFPHKQNCVYHLKRKHKIMCDTVDQYVSSGLVVYQSGPGGKLGMNSPGENPAFSPGSEASQHSHDAM